jgi:RimJ/RimL family protein N-acetyltransferase
MTHIRRLRAEDAGLLFPLIFGSPVTDNLVWDGPSSFDEYARTMAGYAEETERGEKHVFTIVEAPSNLPIGSIGVRPYSDGFRADIGLWIGEAFHGRGHGTNAIALASEYGFRSLGLEKIEAFVFAGNYPSRKAFERSGFELEGLIRCAIRKHGVFVYEWLLGRLRS